MDGHGGALQPVRTDSSRDELEGRAMQQQLGGPEDRRQHRCDVEMGEEAVRDLQRGEGIKRVRHGRFAGGGRLLR